MNPHPLLKTLFCLGSVLGGCWHTSKTDAAWAGTGVNDSSRKTGFAPGGQGVHPYQTCPVLGVGEAPEPQGRLKTSRLLRRFSVTAHESSHHHKRRKAGTTPQAAGQQPCVQPRGGSKLIRCSGVSSQAGKTSCAPWRLTLQLPASRGLCAAPWAALAQRLCSHRGGFLSAGSEEGGTPEHQ